MTHPANESLKEIEDNYFEAVQALLRLIDKHGVNTVNIALEEATECWNAEHEEEQDQ